MMSHSMNHDLVNPNDSSKGPIGLLSAIAARAKGACDIWMTDVIDSRLELARSMGIKTINVMGKSKDDVVQ